MPLPLLMSRTRSIMPLLFVLLVAAVPEGADGQEKTGSYIIEPEKKGSRIIGRERKGERFKIHIKIKLEPERDEKALKAIEWEEMKGQHFVIYFAVQKRGSGDEKISAKLSGEREFAGKALRRAERYYEKIADGLGYRRLSDFWTWERRAKIYIYPSNVAFMKDAGRPGWSRGAADYTKRTIFGHHGGSEKEFLDEVLPHELGHLIFRDFIGFKGEAPLWLDEGVAQLQEAEGGKRKLARKRAREILWKDRFLSLEDLVLVKGEVLREEMTTRSVREFYVQALSLVDFMLAKESKSKFEKFCRQLRKGKSLDDALRFSYPTSIRDTSELEKKWIEYIREGKHERKKGVHAN